jgi:hypothetical protein
MKFINIVYLHNAWSLNNCRCVLNNLHILLKCSISNDENWGSVGEFCRDNWYIFTWFTLFGGRMLEGSQIFTRNMALLN